MLANSKTKEDSAVSEEKAEALGVILREDGTLTCVIGATVDVRNKIKDMDCENDDGCIKINLPRAEGFALVLEKLKEGIAVIFKSVTEIRLNNGSVGIFWQFYQELCEFLDKKVHSNGKKLVDVDNDSGELALFITPPQDVLEASGEGKTKKMPREHDKEEYGSSYI